MDLLDFVVFKVYTAVREIEHCLTKEDKHTSCQVNSCDQIKYVKLCNNL